jgi:crossover junction endodeoxyribonuclease RuvC
LKPKQLSLTIPQTTLGIDASSTTMGYCVLDVAGSPTAHGAFTFKGEIADRIVAAHNAFCDLLDTYAPDVVAIEAPFAVRSTSAIPLARVNGVLILVAALRGVRTIDVPPTVAKKRLTGKGNASKDDMCEAAKPHIGEVSEHTADALAIALSVWN